VGANAKQLQHIQQLRHFELEVHQQYLFHFSVPLQGSFSVCGVTDEVDEPHRLRLTIGRSVENGDALAIGNPVENMDWYRDGQPASSDAIAKPNADRELVPHAVTSAVDFRQLHVVGDVFELTDVFRVIAAVDQ
jgi:uncharacterized protein YndB with AHSA1/START domain